MRNKRSYWVEMDAGGVVFDLSLTYGSMTHDEAKRVFDELAAGGIKVKLWGPTVVLSEANRA